MGIDDLSGLPADEWERIQSSIASFEEAWCRGERPRIDDHIRGDEPHPSKVRRKKKII